jgi:hypothetical protein
VFLRHFDGIDVDYDSHEDAAFGRAANSENEVWHAPEEFLWENLPSLRRVG